MGKIAIMVLVDVIGALSDDSLSKNVYLIDNNKSNGSSGEGTEVLKTPVKKGDQLTWTILGLEPETYSTCNGIDIDPQYCAPVMQHFPDSDITYWTGTILKDLTDVQYSLTIAVGSPTRELKTLTGPFLISAK